MTYYVATIRVLRSVGRPLNSREIMDEILRAMLYKSITYADSEIIKIYKPGGGSRAKYGSVYCTLRHTLAR
jgi:hypothetical protein